MFGSRSKSVTYANVNIYIYIDSKLNKSVRACIVCTRVAAAAEALVRSQGSPWGGYGEQIGAGTFCITEAIKPWHLTSIIPYNISA